MTTKKTTHEYWEHSRLRGPVIALDYRATDGPCPERPVLLAASRDFEPMSVEPVELGRFLQGHDDCRFVCVDAARLHWDLLRVASEEDTKQALWDLSRQCRLVDLELLDQRLRLALDGIFPRRRLLSEMVSCYAVDREPQIASSPRSGDDRVRDMLAVWQSITGILDNVLGEPNPQFIRFGPMATGLDVQGSIAFAAATDRGLEMNAQAANRLFQLADDCFQENCAALRANDRARPQFRWEKGRVAVAEDGSVLTSEVEIRKWLWSLLESLRGDHRERFVPPMEEAGQLALDPELWSDLVLLQPALRAWRDLRRSEKLTAWLRTQLAVMQAHPEYTMIPYLRSTSPHLTFAQNLNCEVFRPRSGYRFLIVQLKNLELRCWAHIAERRRPGGVYIAQMFRDGDDPVAYTAARLLELETGQDLLFDELHRLKEIEDGYWLRLARALLDDLVHALTKEQFKGLLNERFQEKASGTAEARRLRSLLVPGIYDHLHSLLDDRTAEIISQKLGISEQELFEALVQFTQADALENLPGRIRDVLNADQQTGQIIKKLKSISRDSETRSSLTDRVIRQLLLAGQPVTPSGGVGRIEFGLRRHAARGLMLADEVRKAVAFTLVSTGYDLVAHEAEEFVLEVGGKAVREKSPDIHDVVNAVLGTMLDDLGDRCCLIRTADRW